MLTLTRYTSDNTAVLPLKKQSILLGSDKECDIVIPDTAPAAANLEFSNGGYRIIPLSRTNLLLNDKKIKSTILQPGDRITAGESVFIFGRRDDLSAGRDSEDLTGILAGISELADCVSSRSELQGLLEKLIAVTLEAIGGNQAFIFSLGADAKPALFASTSSKNSSDRFSDSIVQNVLKKKKGIVLPNALADSRFSSSQSIADLKLSSALCCPITLSGSLIGILYLGSSGSVHSYTDEDLEKVKIFTLVAAMLIHHLKTIEHQGNLIKKLTDAGSEPGFIASSPVMSEALVQAESCAVSDISVLLIGETGTGKDEIAKYIHKKSSRADNSFVAVNCSTLHGELLESELFGHRKGAFTGAADNHTGLFEAADNGTLFLDEIGEMSPPLQAKLLRALETGSIRPLGATEEINVDTRILCATNRNIDQLLKENLFREDLYFRINQFSIALPPLRERGMDIELLAYLFLEKYNSKYQKFEFMDFHPETLSALTMHEWPGNIRELDSTIHRAVLSSKEPILSISFEAADTPITDFIAATSGFQRPLIIKTINSCGGNKEKAAEKLNMSRSTFFRYCKQLEC